MELVVKSGPSGGIGGLPFDDAPPQPHARIRELRIWSGLSVEALQLVHSCEGELFECPKRGQSAAGFSVLKLEPDDYINEISGRYSGYVDQIAFHTHSGLVRRFGSAPGLHDFCYCAPRGYQIVGLWGRAGRLLDALGVYMVGFDE